MRLSKLSDKTNKTGDSNRGGTHTAGPLAFTDSKSWAIRFHKIYPAEFGSENDYDAGPGDFLAKIESL
jgi:hypothetical protein